MFSIIIPAFNEENSINNTIKYSFEIIQELGDNSSEIIVVDDGSTDSTYEIVSKTRCSVYKHPHNLGYGRAIKTGIIKARNDTLFIIDADGTYPIEQLPNLLAEYVKGYDMVVGARKGKFYHGSIMKKFYRFILKIIVEFTTGRKIPDINSGLRVFSKKTVIPYLDSLCDTFSFTTSLTLAYMMTARFVKYLPISYEMRSGKSKVRLIRDSIRTMQFIIEAILYYNPIKIYIVFSLLLVFIGLISLVVAFFTSIMITYILGISAVLLAILMFGIGLISIQINQITKQINKRND